MSDYYDRQHTAIDRLREGVKSMGDLLDDIDWSMFDMCQCGHRRIEHRPVTPSFEGGHLLSCGHATFVDPLGPDPRRVPCGCEDFEAAETVGDVERVARLVEARRLDAA